MPENWNAINAMKAEFAELVKAMPAASQRWSVPDAIRFKEICSLAARKKPGEVNLRGALSEARQLLRVK